MNTLVDATIACSVQETGDGEQIQLVPQNEELAKCLNANKGCYITMGASDGESSGDSCGGQHPEATLGPT